MDKDIIQRKLSRATLTFSEMEVLFKNGFYIAAINRLYYSCFYATQALLLTINLMPKTHKGIVKLLHEHFVNKGLFENSKAEFYNDLLKERLEGDYGDLLILDEDEMNDFFATRQRIYCIRNQNGGGLFG
jgi:uncharacterized protein (UPF0332 family)